jgi:hypothetical protein
MDWISRNIVQKEGEIDIMGKRWLIIVKSLICLMYDDDTNKSQLFGPHNQYYLFIIILLFGYYEVQLARV